MKTKEQKDLKNKSIDQLKKLLADLEKDATNSRLELGQGKVKNVHLQRSRRKDMARILTILNIKMLSLAQDKEAKNVSK